MKKVNMWRRSASACVTAALATALVCGLAAFPASAQEKVR
jgi:hypothetical protein